MYMLLTLFVFIGAMVLQTSVLHLVPIGGIKPDLILIIVVYLGLLKGPEIGCSTGFVFGLIEDFFSGMYLGSNALTKTIIGFVCGMGGKQLYTHSIFSQILCVGLSTLADVTLVLSIKGFGGEWKHILLYETLYNIICCPFIVLIFRQGEKRLGIRSSSPNF